MQHSEAIQAISRSAVEDEADLGGNYVQTRSLTSFLCKLEHFGQYLVLINSSGFYSLGLLMKPVKQITCLHTYM